jgi:hypothetical protein
MPRTGRDRARPQVRRRDNLSASESSSMSSDAPIYSQEDSTYLLHGYADWAELPTDQNDTDLEQIRQRFLRQDSSFSSNPSRTDSVAKSSRRRNRMDLRLDSPDRAGLPAGFYRRKDGVIHSLKSSNDSSSNQSSRYTEEIKFHDSQGQDKSNEAAEGDEAANRSIDPGNSKDSTKYGTPMAWLPDRNSVTDSVASDTKNESTYQTSIIDSTIPTEVRNDNNSSNKGLVSALVRSFEETINEFRTGVRRSEEYNATETTNKKQTKETSDESIVSTAVSTVSTPSVIRKAKGKATAAAAAAVAAALAKRSTLPRQQYTPRPQVPPVPSGWGFDPAGHSSFSESEGYDDSTITTKESRMPKYRAIVDVSDLPEEERPEYLDPVMSDEQHIAEVTVPPSFPTNRKVENEENSILQPRRIGETYHQQMQWHALQPNLYNPHQAQRSVPNNAISEIAYFPEPTRKGDMVPEMVSGRGAAVAPSVVSDISSLPRSKANNFLDFTSLNAYGGGLSVDDNITGFIDKMALALRLAVFQPNGCR